MLELSQLRPVCCAAQYHPTCRWAHQEAAGGHTTPSARLRLLWERELSGQVWHVAIGPKHL